jgi:hypothetical protein
MDTFLSNIQYTPVIVRRIIYNTLTEWCTTVPAPTIDVTSFNPDIQGAYRQQSQIGWHQLFNGRLAIFWKHIITKQLQHNKIPDNEMTANDWGDYLVNKIFELVLQSWLLRNSEAHVLNTNNESRLTRQRLIDQIIALQESSPDIRYCDRDFVYKSVIILEQYSLSSLRSWYWAAISIVKANDTRNRVSRRQQTIQQAFQTARFPVPTLVKPRSPSPAPNIVAPGIPPPAPNLAISGSLSS